MVSDRLKDFIFKKLYKDLSHVEIIEYKGEIWFIDRKEKFWYFIYTKSNGEMWWRYSFFSPFFLLFSLPSNEFSHILSSWVEEVLNCKVTTTFKAANISLVTVEEVLNCKVTATEQELHIPQVLVEEVLNYKVTKTETVINGYPLSVEEVLNCKVTKSYCSDIIAIPVVEDILNYKVNETNPTKFNFQYEVEEVLNKNINK